VFISRVEAQDRIRKWQTVVKNKEGINSIYVSWDFSESRTYESVE
jgi:hypothetical protein